MGSRDLCRRRSVHAAAIGIVAVAWATSCTAILGDFKPAGPDSSGGGGGSSSASTSTSSHHGSSSTSSGPGGGGAGGAGECNDASDCPPPQHPCRQAMCMGHKCGFATVENQASPYQVPGDCQTLTCDGSGAPISMTDESDVDDLNACTDDKCVGPTKGMPVHDPLTGQPCHFDGGKFCNDLAQCVECATYQNCPMLGACDPDTYTCLDPTCADGIKNQDETAADCGGMTCTVRCALGQACVATSDCGPTLTCAASYCKRSTGGACTTNAECATDVCQTNICRVATCANGVMDGTESAVDCGGTACKKCLAGQACATNADCASGTCNTATPPFVCL